MITNLKKSFSVLVIIFMALPLLIAQAPQKFSYQAVARDANGKLINDKDLVVVVGILQNSGFVWAEEHTVHTNDYGLFDLNIGTGIGSGTAGSFENIDWANGVYEIQIEIDDGGGFVNMGISELMSVPYALVAASSPPGPEGPAGPKGDQGEPGPKGDTGEKGDPGDKGDKGDPGDKGDKGDKGDPGTGLMNQGSWTSGTTYNPGDYVFDRSTDDAAVNSMWILEGDIYTSNTQPYLDAAHWVEFQAPAGPEGPKGDKGDQGEQGIAGLPGVKGDPGEKGDKGDPGEKGDKGDKGDPGDQGPIGLTGATGPPGVDGVDGAIGPKGDKPLHQWSGTELRFENPDGSWGIFVDLKGDQGEIGPEGPEASDDQRLLFDNPNLSIQRGNTVNLSSLQDGFTDADANPSNELQTLTGSGHTLTLSQGGGSYTVPDNVNDADASVTNELQALTSSGHTIYLSRGGGSVTIPDNVNDGDYNSTNEIQDLNLNSGALTITNNAAATNIDLSGFVASERAWQEVGNNVVLPTGSVGVGTVSPEGVMDVAGSLEGDEPIFQVKNNEGIPVFAVYNEGVRVYIPEDLPLSKGIKGGFAVGGYNSEKALDPDDYFFQVMPEGSNVNFFSADDSKSSYDDSKGIKGGFAIGGYNSASKDVSASFLYMDPYAAPIEYTGGPIILPLYDGSPKGNCYVGTMAGQNHRGTFNTSLGYQSGFLADLTVTGTWPNFFYNIPSCNTNLGAFAGYANIIGDYNVYLGYSAGYNNIGSRNVFIGHEAGSQETNISDKLYIANDDTDEPLIWGDFAEKKMIVTEKIGINMDPYFALDISTVSGESLGFRVLGNGYVTGYMRAASFPLSSDARLKENIVPIQNALDILRDIRGVRFNFIQDAHPEHELPSDPQLGVIAQEVEAVLPELVDEDPFGMKTVDYNKLTPVLLEAIKEQQVAIVEMQKTIEVLSKKVEELSK